MSGTVCRICGSAARGGEQFGDALIFACLGGCGCYRLADTVLAEVSAGTRTLPEQSQFIELLSRLRKGSGDDCPKITTHDLSEDPPLGIYQDRR